MVTLNTIQYYTETDNYYYTTDNRPLEDLEANDIALNAGKLDISGGTISGDLTVGGKLKVNPSGAERIRLTGDITGSASGIGISNTGEIKHGVIVGFTGFKTQFSTEAFTGYTLPLLQHIVISQGTVGAGSSITTQRGLVIESTVAGASINYGIVSQIPASSTNYNLYISGTANNYLAGSLGIGILPLSNSVLSIDKAITGGTSAYGILSTGLIQSDVTSSANYFATTAGTTAASFTLTNLRHFAAYQGSIGAGSTVTNQYGFYASSTLTGATNNYGFYSNIASGANRWNFYAPGTAPNSLVGITSVGTTTINTSGDKSAVLQLAETTGSGIYLGNTNNSAANVLDWYEEGTFTPTIEGSSTPGTGTYLYQIGSYTRIGNRIFFTVSLSWTASTGAGNMVVRLVGLPNSDSTTNLDVPLSLAADSFTYTNTPKAILAAGTNTINFFGQSSGAALAAIALDTSAKLVVSGSYKV
mgnify:CR=1 FL=1